MASISKRQKLIEEVKMKESEVDMISNLPSSVIGHILSFLPTKYAVATSVLSTKWKYLWTSITNLDLDDELLLVPFNPRKSTKRKLQLLATSFINFVCRVLMRNVSDLQKFRLKCTWSYDVSHFNAWVSTALSRNVRELHLCLYRKENHVPPPELFTCTSLLVLELEGRFVLNVPALVSLKNLKILHLHSITFSNDSVNRLFPGCPMLENLSIMNGVWINISAFNIFAPALKSLIIKTLGWDHKNTISWKHKIVLNTPNLRHLHYADYVAKAYSMNNLNALVKAKINLELQNWRFDSSVHDKSVKELVEGISKVQRLHLYGSSLKLGCSVLPRFSCLTYLKLDGSYKLEFLLRLLERTPQLDTLVFKGCLPGEYNSHWDPPQDVPSCLLFHLKAIEIIRFGGYEGELKIAEYFLKNAKVLKKLMIHISMNPKEWVEVSKKLLMLSRGSQSCQVVIS